jgi:NAD(P)-dependent dehydrogenase (short-subunit alcohol dehydrogenase family)
LRRGASEPMPVRAGPWPTRMGASPVTLDVTNAAQIQGAVERVESLDILINNAGLALFDDLGDRAALERHLAVNLFGTYGVTHAFLPLLTRSRGAIVNVLSVAAFAALPIVPAYSISKAAAFSLSQSLRALLAGLGVRVHAVLAGPVDTDMSRDFDVPKASPGSKISHLLARTMTTTSARMSIGRSVGREAKKSVPSASTRSLRKVMKPSSAMNAS